MNYRKIVVGSDIKNGFHFSIGQKVLNDKYTIHAFSIKKDRVVVYIENDIKEVSEWWNYPLNMVSFQENID